MPTNDAEAAAHPVQPQHRVPRLEVSLRLLAFLLFVLIALVVGIPLLTFSDIQWSDRQLVVALTILEDLLQLLLLLLLGVLAALMLRRRSDVRRMVWELWSMRVLLAGGGAMFALYAWWVILDMGADPYGPPTHLPHAAAPLGIAVLVLMVAGGLVMLPELFWRLARAQRARQQ